MVKCWIYAKQSIIRQHFLSLDKNLNFNVSKKFLSDKFWHDLVLSISNRCIYSTDSNLLRLAIK